MTDIFQKIYEEICDDPENKEMKQKWYEPVYTAWAKAKIVIVGQAPGRKAQETKKPWNDVSWETLRKWLWITDEQFYDPDLISLMPMDFYYPWKGSHWDLPPRKWFAEKWHPILLENMPEVKLFILIWAYSQKYYLAKNIKSNLTETVHSYEEYLPKYFPIVHPSPLNFRWRSKNPWFEDDVIPKLQELIQEVIEEK